MRIIQVVNVRWFNATAWYGVELARLFTKYGHECLVLGLEGSPPLEKAKELGLDCIALPLNTKFNQLSLYRSLSKVIKDFKPDIVNCHRGESFLLWSLLKKVHKFALVRTRGDQRLPKANLVNLYLHKKTDAIVATNSKMAKHFVTKMKIKKTNVHTIYGGVATCIFRFDEEERKKIRAKLKYEDNDFVIGLLGRFDKVKGQKECIEAVSKLVKQGFNVKLLLLGFASATSLDEVKSWIEKEGIKAQVQITGKVDNVPSYLSAIDLGVVSSLYSETIARAALEIMSCDRPLISTNVGVMPDLLPHDALCEPGNVDELANLIQKSIEDKDWLEEIRYANNEMMKNLDTQYFYEQTNEVYKSIIKK